MSVLDTLEVIIEADATGLTSVFQSAVNTMTGFVDKMNSQQVDWTKILSESLDPAIITGIASTFALAIASAIQFQQQMTNLGNATNTSGASLTQLGANTQSVAETTGQSTSDISAAFQSLLPVMDGNVDAANQAVQAVAELSYSGFGSMADIVSSVIPILQAFGATTGDQAVQVLTDLMQAASASGQAIPTIGDAFQQITPGLVAAKVSVSDLQNILDEFGATVPVAGLQQTTDIFKGMANAAGNLGQSGIALAAIAGGATTLADELKDGKTGDALDHIVSALKSWPTVAWPNFGIPPADVAAVDQITKDLPIINQNATDVSKLNIATVFANSATIINDMKVAWQTIVVSLQDAYNWVAKIVDDHLPVLKTLFESVGTTVKILVGDISSLWGFLSQTGVLHDLGTAFDVVVSSITLMVDFLNAGLVAINALGTGLKDVLSGDLKDVGKDMANIFNGTQMQNILKSEGLTLNNLGVFAPSGTPLSYNASQVNPQNSTSTSNTPSNASQTNNFYVTAAKGSEATVANQIASKIYSSSQSLNSGNSSTVPFSTGTGIK